jgi:hypothetical protein
VLKSPETRKACTILQNIDDALAMLDTLPLPALEAIRDYVADQTKGRTGATVDFMRAFETYLAEPLKGIGPFLDRQPSPVRAALWG